MPGVSLTVPSRAPAGPARAAGRSRALLATRLALALAAVAILGAGAFGVARYVNAYWLYRGFPPPKTPAGVPAGTFSSGVFYSHTLHRRADYGVYLPPHYAEQAAAGRRFSTLYMLHAPVGLPFGVFNAGALAVSADELTHSHRIRPMIIVDPVARTSRFANDTEWADARAGRYDAFVAELAHVIDRRYATIADRQHRGVGGLSMGGYGAVNVALHHPRLFSVAESWSGYYTQTPTGPFAGLSAARLADNSPLVKVERVAPAIRRLGLRAFVYQGNHDDVPARTMIAFAHELRRAGGVARYAVYPGKHNWRLWRAHIPQMLLAASHWFGQTPRPGAGR